MGCERALSAAADGGAGLWWRPCCGAVCLSLLCLACSPLAWPGLCRWLCGGPRAGGVREGWAGGVGLFRWGGVRWCGLVVCPGGGVWCRGVAVVGPAGGVCRWGLVSGVWGRVSVGLSVCFCAGVGVAGWVVPGVGGPGWGGVEEGCG